MPDTTPNDSNRTSGADPNQRPGGEFAQIGRYQVRRVLGTGSFGRVYLAFDPLADREVAIKMPLAAVLTDGLRERFLREARATARIHHPNICPVYDLGTEGPVPYLVMRYVGSGTLEGLVTRRMAAGQPFSAGEAVGLAEKLARGLAAAHARNVLHRDIKPANVLWEAADGEVLVTDFGLARIADEARLSVSGTVGTPLYMSPEQFRGRSAEVGPPSDVYSLGVILYELVTGGLPFEGESTFDLMVKVGHNPDPPRRPSEVLPGLDPRLDDICAKALAKKVEDRYPTATALADALAEFLGTTGGGAGTRNSAVPQRDPRIQNGAPDDPAEAARRHQDIARHRAESELAADFAEWRGVMGAEGSASVWMSRVAHARVERWRSAAELGDARGQVLYGDYLECGTGAECDHKAAMHWYRKAAEQGDADAQYAVGVLHDSGLGVERSEAEAERWYRAAAQNGHRVAQLSIGSMYRVGRGVPQNDAEALRWFRLAADCGDADAQKDIGAMFFDGRGVPQDYAEALRWFRLAADQGHAEAQKEIGVMYAEGKGVPKDARAATGWFRKSAAQGNEVAKRWLKSLAPS